MPIIQSINLQLALQGITENKTKIVSLYFIAFRKINQKVKNRNFNKTILCRNN